MYPVISLWDSIVLTVPEKRNFVDCRSVFSWPVFFMMQENAICRMCRDHLKNRSRPTALILSMIYEKYLGSDLTSEEKKLVKDIDDRMLAYDLKILLHEDVGELPAVNLKLNYDFPGFDVVEHDFLDRFQLLRNLLKEN